MKGMNLFKTKGFWESFILSIVPLIITSLVYYKLPETIAVHFNFAFEPDTFAPRWMTIVISLYLILINLLIWTLTSLPSQRDKIDKKVLTVLRFMIPVIGLFTQLSLLAYAFYDNALFIRLVPLIVGIVLIILGNFTPKIKPNRFIGARFPWVYEDRDVWDKTQRAFGKGMMILGLFFTLCAFFDFPATLIIIALLLCIVIPTFYSYFLTKK